MWRSSVEIAINYEEEEMLTAVRDTKNKVLEVQNQFETTEVHSNSSNSSEVQKEPKHLNFKNKVSKNHSNF